MLESWSRVDFSVIKPVSVWETNQGDSETVLPRQSRAECGGGGGDWSRAWAETRLEWQEKPQGNKAGNQLRSYTDCTPWVSGLGMERALNIFYALCVWQSCFIFYVCDIFAQPKCLPAMITNKIGLTVLQWSDIFLHQLRCSMFVLNKRTHKWLQ